MKVNIPEALRTAPGRWQLLRVTCLNYCCCDDDGNDDGGDGNGVTLKSLLKCYLFDCFS